MSGEATSPLMPVDLEEEEDVETRGRCHETVIKTIGSAVGYVQSVYLGKTEKLGKTTGTKRCVNQTGWVTQLLEIALKSTVKPK